MTFEECEGGDSGVMILGVGCHVKLAGRSRIFGNKGGSAGVALIRGRAPTLEITGDLCARNNTATQGVGSFAYIENGGALRVADNASVLVDNPSPDVYVQNVTHDLNLPGRIFCGSASTSSWQPGSFDITGNLCACSESFESGNARQSKACDGCGGAGWDAELCACKVGGFCALGCTESETS